MQTLRLLRSVTQLERHLSGHHPASEPEPIPVHAARDTGESDLIGRAGGSDASASPLLVPVNVRKQSLRLGKPEAGWLGLPRCGLSLKRHHRFRDHLQRPRRQRSERQCEARAAVFCGVCLRTSLAHKHHSDDKLEPLHTDAEACRYRERTSVPVRIWSRLYGVRLCMYQSLCE